MSQLGVAAINEAQQSLKRQLEISRKTVTLLENKPFWLPLTSAEQHALADAKTAIATLTIPAPTPTPNQERQDESMKPTTEASEAERQRRREAQETYPHAKAVSPEGNGGNAYAVIRVYDEVGNMMIRTRTRPGLNDTHSFVFTAALQTATRSA